MKVFFLFLNFLFSENKSPKQYTVKSLTKYVKVENVYPIPKIWQKRCNEIEKIMQGQCILLKVKNNSSDIIAITTSKNKLLATGKTSFIFVKRNEGGTSLHGTKLIGKPKHSILNPNKIGYYLYLVEPFNDYFPLESNRAERDRLKRDDLREIDVQISEISNLSIEIKPINSIYFY